MVVTVMIHPERVCLRELPPCQNRFDKLSAITWERCEIKCKLVLLTIESHILAFDWYQNW